MSQPIIEVRNLSKRYQLGAIGATSLREEASRLWDRARGIPHPDAKEFWALRDVSFDIQPGEVVGVIGRNGAGKSTLLKILSRITEPTSGTAKLRGRVASLLEVGTGFHPELTGRENVFLNGAILGMSRAEVRRKFDEIVAFSEVDQFIDTPVKRYSSGMYVRLAFAVAAHLEPEILIVDEVLAVGDDQFQQKCLGKIQSIAQHGGRAVLFVSHNMGPVMRLCTHAILLQDGRVSQSGLTADVATRYLTNNAGSATYTAPEGKTNGILSLVTQPPTAACSDLKVSVAFRTEHLLKRPTMGIVIYTLGGMPLFGSNSLFHPWARDPGPQSAGTLEVTFKNVPLWTGTYKLSAWLSDANYGVDHVPDAVTVEILSRHLPSNAPTPNYIGSVHVRGDWEFCP
jgi:lipopolysaccharide transport system ATP-binding protein